MAAPPSNLPPIPSNLFFNLQSQTNQGRQPPPPPINPLADPETEPRLPDFSFHFGAFPQPAEMATTLRADNGEPPANRPQAPHVPTEEGPSGPHSQPASRSRSPSHSPGPSEQSSNRDDDDEDEGSEDDDDDTEEPSDTPSRRWYALHEDTTIACEDEIKYAQQRGEHSATENRDYFEQQAHFPLDDPSIKVVDSGRLEWTVEHFNGTKEAPNNELIMRSQSVSIGGYDWRIKFFPLGNGTPFISIYVENVTLQSPDIQESEDITIPPFPLLSGHDYGKVSFKKHPYVAAQLGMVIHNPAEARTHEERFDAHQFSRSSPDYGWKYFMHRDDLPMRKHGQREALLRRDQLAFTAYIRVLDDPTGTLWQHDEIDESRSERRLREKRFDKSVLNTGLRPFAGQAPVMAATVPLLHYKPFRDIVKRIGDAKGQAGYGLQEMLWKMFSRTKSSAYGSPGKEVGTADCISWMSKITSMLIKEEVAESSLVEQMVGKFDMDGRGAVRTNRLKTKEIRSVQKGVNKLTIDMAKTHLLTIELERQEFNRKERRWNKLTGKVSVEDVLYVGDTQYHLYAVWTHCGALTSNKHNVYIQLPSHFGGGGLWYAYEDSKVSAKTRKQAVEMHEGLCEEDVKGEKLTRRDSPFAGFQPPGGGMANGTERDEVIYAVMYVRSDQLEARLHGKMESWNAPQSVKDGKRWKQRQRQSPLASSEAQHHRASEEQNGVTHVEFQEHAERQTAEHNLRVANARREHERGGTPNWPLTDEEGDVLMSDDGEPAFSTGSSTAEDYAAGAPVEEDLTASTSLSSVPMAAAPVQKPDCPSLKRVTLDCLGRDYYSGFTLNGKYHGRGHLITQSGDEYRGSFEQGQKSGNGTILYSATGNTYTGSWKNDQHHGQGSLTEVSTGYVYDGGWREGKKHGPFVLKGIHSEEERSLCTICYEEPLNTVFDSCGHVVTCFDCAQRVEECPLCRRLVRARVRVWGIKMTAE
ncbi:hypothetical protein D0868_09510 [Hortaea werneckii]|uniref:RING-type domain-containing protein n=1 Tax=Hortaea werneckii TaxID=91943 RepID=A0A3M6Y9N7_HORWE|nr:hypothetical protein D0868_09510 [Hortaea werneckii]